MALFMNRTALAQILRLPPSLRSAVYRSFTTTTARPYYSYESVPPPLYNPSESAILSSALSHVPEYGFTIAALRKGAKDVGMLDVSTNLFPRGEVEIVLWHLRNQRTGLKDRIMFPEEEKRVGKKVKALVLERLRGNVDAGVVGRWTEAVALMSLAGNIPISVQELHFLSDEIWFLAGDVSVDASWYTKRATLSTIYAATELFQTKDQSSEGRDTEDFLDRRLEDARVLGSSWRNVREWAGFQGIAMVNLARSLGARI